MSKKNNRRYRPRHTRSEEIAAQADYQSPTKRSLKDKQLQMSGETADEMFFEQKPSMPIKKTAFASRVNLTSIEDQPKPFREAAADTPDESSDTFQYLSDHDQLYRYGTEGVFDWQV